MKESEYDGGGVMPNGVYPQEDGADLSARDKLRLLSRTGQTEDSRAPVDPYYWHGNSKEEPVYKTRRPKPLTQRQRYTESPS